MGEIHSSYLERGQILLVVVLAAVISLTVGLSVASRVITNTKNTTEDTSSQKALSAAEAGVEQALKTNTDRSVSFNNGSSVVTKNVDYTSTDLLFNQGNSLNSGVDLWLSDNPGYTNPRDITFTVYWTGTTCPDSVAAVEVIILTGTKNAPSVTRKVYDPCGSRANSNNFSDATTLDTAVTIGSVDFNRTSGQIVVSKGLIARIIPLYASTKFGVKINATTGASPAQGTVIDSTGTSGNSTKKLRVVQGYPKLPDDYYYSLILP